MRLATCPFTYLSTRNEKGSPPLLSSRYTWQHPKQKDDKMQEQPSTDMSHTHPSPHPLPPPLPGIAKTYLSSSMFIGGSLFYYPPRWGHPPITAREVWIRSITRDQTADQVVVNAAGADRRPIRGLTN